jgi:hypothetical protein
MEGTPRYGFDNRILSSDATAGLSSSVSQLSKGKNRTRKTGLVGEEPRRPLSKRAITQRIGEEEGTSRRGKTRSAGAGKCPRAGSRNRGPRERRERTCGWWQAKAQVCV